MRWRNRILFFDQPHVFMDERRVSVLFPQSHIRTVGLPRRGGGHIIRFALIAFVLLGGIAGFASEADAAIGPSDFADGTHRVGIDIAPGTYVAEIESGICSVGITDIDEETRNPTFIGRAIVTITSSDNVVETSSCGIWKPRFDRVSEPPSIRFEEGMHEVGVDIRPGIYTSTSNDGRCVWFTVDDFMHQPASSNLITWWKTGEPIAEIKPDSAGFYSIRCGTWNRRDAGFAEEPLTHFGDGSYLVGIDIAPGTYIADAGNGFCDWFRTAPFGDTSPDNSGGYVSKGRQVATIFASDTGFHSDGCGIWRPLEPANVDAVPDGVIGVGTLIVGSDVNPGVYFADAAENRYCRWFTLRGFAGRPADIIASGTGVVRGIVELTPETVGFRSVDCGSWTSLSNATNLEAHKTFGEGEHIVNVHVAPGTYVSPGDEQGRCWWRRLSDFDGSDAAQLAVRNPVGRNITQITPHDAVFESFGCGDWEVFDPVKDRDLREMFGRGTWAVESEIPAGTYFADVPEGSTCFWSRLSGFDGEPSAFVTSELAVGRSITTVQSFDVGFYSDGCGDWKLVPNVSDFKNVARNTKFDDGVYIVGRDIAPGTYVSSVIEGEICFWSRLTGFDGDPFKRLNIYASEGQAIATILPSDAGFRSFGCGEWNPLRESTRMMPAFSDGTYEVGVDIDPGTYIVSDAQRSTCKWRRLSDFTWTSGTIVETKASGQKIVTIRDTDVGFATYGCGEWNVFVAEGSGPVEPPPSRFSGGSYVVGVHIEPGTYYSVPRRGGGCRWRRVSGFSGDSDETIAEGESDDRWIVTIEADDVGFVTHGCGLWRNIEIALKIGPYSDFEDGVRRVGADIVAGTYASNVSIEPFIDGYPVPKCKWWKVTGFSHDQREVTASGGGRGRIEVTLTESDVGFVSTDCGHWTRETSHP